MKATCFPKAAAVLMLLAFRWAGAAPQQFQCLSDINPTAIVVPADAEWVPFPSSPLRLHSAWIAAGPPDTESRMRGETIIENKRSITTRYGIDGKGFVHGKWLECVYGEAGEVTMSRRLPEPLRQCTIRMFNRVPGESRRIDIACH